MAHTFSLMPQSYLVHQKIQGSQWKYACVSCGVWASDPAGGGCIHSDCTAFNKAHKAVGGHNPYAPGGKGYPFSFQWIGAPVPPPAPAQAPPMTASGLPIRVPQEAQPAWAKSPPPEVVTPGASKHRAGLDPEEIDWQAHKEFLKGM